MRVAVLGLGQVGYPTAVLLAAAGHTVVGVDVSESLIVRLCNGEAHPAYSAGVPQFPPVTGSLAFQTHPPPADAFVICVPTPCHLTTAAAGGRTADLGPLWRAARSLAPVLAPGNLVVVNSTVPPGATARVRELLEGSGLRCGTDLFLAHVPERLLPGPTVLEELLGNARVVGGCDPAATQRAAELYRSFLPAPILTTDAATAEFVKLIENTYRDVNIALANEFALLAERLGLDVHAAIALANHHPRVQLAQPGPGVGGHCLPVDPCFLIQAAPEVARLVQTARQVNSAMPEHVTAQALALCRQHRLSRVATLGLSYRADLGDMRESPALQVAARLVEAGLYVAVHDPLITGFDRPLAAVLSDAELAVVLVAHSAYRAELQPALAAAHMRTKLIYDTCCFCSAAWEENGFQVTRLGAGGRS